MRIRSFLCVSFFFLLCLPWIASAATGNTVPTDITADRLQYDSSGQKVIFSGNVHVKRPDFELWSTTLTAYLQKSEGQKSGGTGDMNAGQIERIVAENSVRMKAGVRTGTCGLATYTMADGRLRMERTPIIIDTSNNNRIEGDTIIFHTRDGRSDVLGDVRASFSTAEGGGLNLGSDASADGDGARPEGQ